MNPIDVKGALLRAHDLLKPIEADYPIASPRDCELVDRVREALSNIALAMEKVDQRGE
jgi:hypothetical protein